MIDFFPSTKVAMQVAAIRAAITLLDGNLDQENAETMRALPSNLRAPVADDLPEWEPISAKRDREEALTPLELFVYDNEPAGEHDIWREQLSAAPSKRPCSLGGAADRRANPPAGVRRWGGVRQH